MCHRPIGMGVPVFAPFFGGRGGQMEIREVLSLAAARNVRREERNFPTSRGLYRAMVGPCWIIPGYPSSG